MIVARYWHMMVSAPFCGQYPEVPLSELMHACGLVYGQYGHKQGRAEPGRAAMIVASQTPACWALHELGAHAGVAYVIVEEDFGEVWAIQVSGDAVKVGCALQDDEDGVKELLGQAGSTAGEVVIVRVSGLEAEVVKRL